MFRFGMGYDVHRMKKGRPLRLGGVGIPFDRGLEGHSDADVLLHAVIDALLGAAALPDIGHYFPPGQADTRGIPSSRMLTRVLLELEKQGYHIVNVDSVLLAEAPKVAPYRESIRKSMARLLRIPVSSVQVKGKTNEGLDAIGRGKAMAAHAVVLLEKKARS